MLTAGNVRTFAEVILKFKFDVLVTPSLLKSKKKSLALTLEAGLQGKPLIDMDAFKSATQKSCN